jgi:hypothetical protein
MTTKLHINIGQGILEAEGEETFVQSIYSDFKKQLHEQFGRLKIANTNEINSQPTESNNSIQPKDRSRKTSDRRTSKSADGIKSKTSDYKPTFDPNLDLAKLADFYNQFEPKNHSEKILIFAIFVRDRLKKMPCTADDIYSCYFTLKDQTEIPEAFVQAFRTAWNRTGWVHYVSQSDIKITTAGENYFNQKLKKKKNEAAE